MERYFNPEDKEVGRTGRGLLTGIRRYPVEHGSEKKITVEDVASMLFPFPLFRGTPYDPYAKSGDGPPEGRHRAIGINRNDFRSDPDVMRKHAQE